MLSLVRRPASQEIAIAALGLHASDSNLKTAPSQATLDRNGSILPVFHQKNCERLRHKVGLRQIERLFQSAGTARDLLLQRLERVE